MDSLVNYFKVFFYLKKIYYIADITYHNTLFQDMRKQSYGEKQKEN